ncbi:hypothetical protein EJB05_37306, partial [Eragrostis curvula]
MAFRALNVWKNWATQILVLVSMGLQVVLLFLAGIRRRREAPAILRLPLWLAYLMADSTAIYALGHISLGGTPGGHRLKAFWAPFLLVHLGGPDNITALALQDNQLWPRHLQVLAVPFLGAAYVIYKEVAGTGIFLLLASLLMFGVGLVKCAERTWALRCSNLSSIQQSLKDLPPNNLGRFQGHLREDGQVVSDDEFLLQRSHSLLHICKRGIVDSMIPEDPEKKETETSKILRDLMKRPKAMWTVMEMELSLMYDILYTKAGVVHTWRGYFIRAMSTATIAASFLLFHFSSVPPGTKGGMLDVAVTYILFGVALALETTALLGALGSSWALPFLCTTRWSGLRHAALCAGRWYRLRRTVVSFRRLVAAATWGQLGRSRRWSGQVGQYNMLYFRAAQVHHTHRWLRNMANMVWLGEWWDSYYYKWTVTIPDLVKARSLELALKLDLNTMGMIRVNWADPVLKIEPAEIAKDLKSLSGLDFHESIIIWHVATELCLAHGDMAVAEDDERVGAIRALSNYLMFLLVNHPDMLPGLPQKWLYQRTCQNLDDICRNYPSPSGMTSRLAQAKALAAMVLPDMVPDKAQPGPSIPRLTYAHDISTLINKWYKNHPIKADAAVDLLLHLWTHILIYAANRCNREAHAAKLNTGGEFITLVWLMIEHRKHLKKQ